jgi:hypothetical protein
VLNGLLQFTLVKKDSSYFLFITEIHYMTFVTRS